MSCSNYKPFSGSKVDNFLRHGFHPTKVGYPDIIMRGPNNLDVDFPTIDLSAALASHPFVDSFQWDDHDSGCKALAWDDTYTSSTSRNLMGATAAEVFNLFGRHYGGGWITEMGHIDEIVALSTPNWNHNYYQHVLPELVSANNHPDTFWTYQISTSKSGISHVQKENCFNFSSHFWDLYTSLPLFVENEDFSAYLAFCETFGWYYATGYTIGTQRFYINGIHGVDYLFGQFGSYDTDECLDPSPDSFELSGWDQILDPVGPVANNFRKFYETYPVSNMPSPGLDHLLDEELFTYEPPKSPSTHYTKISPNSEEIVKSYEPPKIASSVYAEVSPGATEGSSTTYQPPKFELRATTTNPILSPDSTMFLSAYVLSLCMLGALSRWHWSRKQQLRQRRMH